MFRYPLFPVVLTLLLLSGCTPYMRGNAALGSGDYRGAEQQYLLQLGEDPGNWRTLTRLSYVRFLQADYEGASKAAEAALAAAPRRSEALYHAGLTALSLGDRQRAMILWEAHRSTGTYINIALNEQIAELEANPDMNGPEAAKAVDRALKRAFAYQEYYDDRNVFRRDGNDSGPGLIRSGADPNPVFLRPKPYLP